MRQGDDGEGVAADGLELGEALRATDRDRHQETLITNRTTVPLPPAVWISNWSASFFTPRRPSPIPSRDL